MKSNGYRLKFILFLLVISLFVFTAVVVVSTQYEKRITAESFATIESEPTISVLDPTTKPTSVPTPITGSEIMESPDGTVTLKVERLEQSESTQYTISTSPTSDQSKYTVYSTNEFDNLTIPYNTWSPDNKYFFLKEIAQLQSNYYVFSAIRGENLGGYLYLSIQELFAEKVTGYTITDVTGWASPNLIIVNAQSDESGNKVSYWFNVTNQSFIRLSSYFH